MPTDPRQRSLKERAEAGCPQCGTAGSHYPAGSDCPEFVQFACGSFIDDAGSFEPAMRLVTGEEDPCEQIARLVTELASEYPGSRYADRVASFTFPPQEDDDAAA